LLHTAWNLKRNLSKSITSNKIDEIYDTAIKEGALGGKLLGAGGGGFFLFYFPKNKIKRVTKNLKKLYICNFNFENRDSNIIQNFF
jgi:D-glycero-alpha-D-manno-heptose-7-phosphate kinase